MDSSLAFRILISPDIIQPSYSFHSYTFSIVLYTVIGSQSHKNVAFLKLNSAVSSTTSPIGPYSLGNC